MSVLRELSRELGDLVARAVPAVVGLRHRGGQGSGVMLSPETLPRILSVSVSTFSSSPPM